MSILVVPERGLFAGDEQVEVDGVRIVADARIDDAPHGLRAVDAIAEAWRQHGPQCAEHLLGDFAFAVWDGRRLFAARDPFGVRPLFTANGGAIVGSSVAAIRATELVSDALDERALARFLLGGTEVFPEETAYRDIRRVRVWNDPSWLFARAKPSSSPPADFLEIFDRAVADRVRGDSAAVLMSGGVDSTSVAVTARRVIDEVHAYTVAFREHDPELAHARAVAQHAELNHHVVVRDDFPLFAGWEELDRAEPYDDAFAAPFLHALRDAASRAPVMLTGHGGDAVLYATRSHFLGLLRQGRVLRFVRDFAGYLLRTGALPPLGFRSALKRRAGIPLWSPQLPPWIRRDVIDRYELRGEFEAAPHCLHPTHPDAQRNVLSPAWPLLFEALDRSQTGIPIEMAYPFFDRRVIELLFSLPPMPWFGDKYLLRRAMRERLPRGVARRAKTPMPARSLQAEIAREAPRLLAMLDDAPEVVRLVDKGVLSARLQQGAADASEAYSMLLPFCLAYWLSRRERAR